MHAPTSGPAIPNFIFYLTLELMLLTHVTPIYLMLCGVVGTCQRAVTIQGESFGFPLCRV